jgi:hypothetical protein
MKMISGTTQTFEIKLTAAIISAQLPFTVVSQDWDTTGASYPLATNGQTNSGTAVTVLAAVGASKTRELKAFSLFNADTSPAEVTFQVNDNSTLRPIGKWTLQVGDTLVYDANGWYVIDKNGIVKTMPTPIYNAANGLFLPYICDLANITTATAFATNTSYAFYIGKATSAASSCDMLYRVATAAVGTVTWAEVGIASGTFVFNGAPTLTRRGFTDVSGVVTGTGTKKTTVALSGVNIGDDLWAVFGGQMGTTQWQTRGMIAHDENQVGVAATFAGRFSTMGSSQVFTAGATGLVHAFFQIKM